MGSFSALPRDTRNWIQDCLHVNQVFSVAELQALSTLTFECANMQKGSFQLANTSRTDLPAVLITCLHGVVCWFVFHKENIKHLIFHLKSKFNHFRNSRLFSSKNMSSPALPQLVPNLIFLWEWHACKWFIKCFLLMMPDIAQLSHCVHQSNFVHLRSFKAIFLPAQYVWRY